MSVYSMCKRILLFLIIGLSGGITLLSQNQYNVWYFGNGAGLDFSSGVPVPLTNGQINTLEGCAVISDPEDGRLLFYTDGVTVWDATHRPMPNGNDLKGHWTSAQSALIVPNPGDTNIFYVFTAGAGFYHTANDPNNGVRYSVVNMQLNGGRGDVIEKNIELLERGRGVEMLNATRHCNGRDYWVVAHELKSNRFFMYLVTPSGITDSVITSIGSVLSGDLGALSMGKFSPNGKMLAVATPGEQTLELYDFDNASGRLLNYRLIASDWYYYGLEFSPDNSKLYVASIARLTEPDFLYQFDLNAGDIQAIRNSRYQLHREEGRWDGAQCQLGPDNRIYVSFRSRYRLGVINFPNIEGAGANYQHNGVQLSGRTTSYGLPNLINADLPKAQSEILNISFNISASSSTLTVGETVTYNIVICNSSHIEVRNVTVSYSLPLGMTDISGGSSTVVISQIPAGECDTLIVQARLDATLPEGQQLTTCVALIDALPAGCVLPDSSCTTLTVAEAPTDTGEIDYTFHILPGCPGMTDRTHVLFNSRRHTDTIISILFDGSDARYFRYGGTSPISFVVRPTIDQRIPIIVHRVRSGPMSTTMRLITAKNDTFRVRIMTSAKASTTPFLNLSEIRLGSRTGTVDTCVVVTNISGQVVTIIDSVWMRAGKGFVIMTNPSLPIVLGSGVSTTLCFQVSNPENGLNDTVTLGAMEAVQFCPHCLHHPIIINTLSPGPAGLAITDEVSSENSFDLFVRPNPIAELGIIECTFVQSGNATVEILDQVGRSVMTIIDDRVEQGHHFLMFDPSNLPSGGYLVYVNQGDRSATHPILILR